MTEPVYYFDCFCGISGDMTVAALLDLGADRAKLDAMIAGLNLDGFDYTVKRVVSGGFDACDFDVVLHDEGHCNRHHEHHHDHDHHHHHGGDHHHHEHRNIRDIRAIIDRSGLSERAKTLAVEMFDVVAEAEAEVHGRPVDEVHFHEVGAIDSIIDILSIAFCIDDLGIKRVAFSPLTEGCGTVMCQHGEIPVPVPAVASIARKYGIPLRLTETRGERVTPTGIAVVAALKNAVRPQDAIVDAVGVGAGKRDFQGANVLRVMKLVPVERAALDAIWVLEANIDDSTGEQLGTAMEELFRQGARDVHYVPCFMKKNRPAWLLRVIADESALPVMEEAIFRTTTTIGLRKFPVERTCMNRETETLTFPFGELVVKKCSFGNISRRYPEYESVKALAEKTGMPFAEIYKLAGGKDDGA